MFSDVAPVSCQAAMGTLFVWLCFVLCCVLIYFPVCFHNFQNFSRGQSPARYSLLFPSQINFGPGQVVDLCLGLGSENFGAEGREGYLSKPAAIILLPHDIKLVTVKVSSCCWSFSHFSCSIFSSNPAARPLPQLRTFPRSYQDLCCC